MVKYKLVKTLLYRDEGAVEGEFIIGEDTLGQAEKLLLKFLIL